MIDFEKLIVAGKIAQISKGYSHKWIIENFGEPDILTPAQKSYPMMLVYGDLEFRFRNDRLETATLTCEENIPQLPNRIIIKHFPSQSNRTAKAIEEILKKNQIGWKKDLIMSDEDQQVYITDKDVHLAFSEGILTKIGVEYGK